MSENPQKIIYDCVVVGAGIEGSCTARYSASFGKKTLCLEQVCEEGISSCTFKYNFAQFVH